MTEKKKKRKKKLAKRLPTEVVDKSKFSSFEWSLTVEHQFEEG